MSIYIDSIYKRRGNAVAYNAIEGKNADIITKKALLTKVKQGCSLSNAYVRGDTIVLKSKYGVKIYDYKGIIRSCCIDDSEPCLTAIKFSAMVTASMLDKTCFDIIYKIDKAEVIDKTSVNGAFRTPFGICDMDGLSNGCKSAVYAYLCERDKRTEVVDTTSMGINACRVLLEELGKENNYVVLGFRGSPLGNVKDFDGFVFYDVNKKVRSNFIEFLLNYVGV